MRKLLSIFSLALLYFTVVYGQAAINIPITVGDNTGASAQIFFGLDLTATDGVDLTLGEDPLPGLPPGGYFAAWSLPTFDLSYRDYRAPGSPAAFPFTGHVSYVIRLQTDVPGGNPMTVSWDLPAGIAATSTIGNGGTQTVSFSGTGSNTWNYNPAPGPNNLQYLFVEVDFVNIAPAGPAPIFGIDQTSLNFGSVYVGSNAMLPVTVSNTGTAALNITNIVSSNAQFTFAPLSPVTIPAGGNQIFNVTFTPTSFGPKSGNITFTHNAAGSPSALSVDGLGVEIIQPSIPTVNLVNVATGSTTPTDITVTNNGATPLLVSASITELPYWDITPSSFTIPAGGNHIFTVSFMAPAIPGSYPGTLVFSATGVPSVTVPLTASVVARGGLIFQQDTVRQMEDASYMEVIQLISLTANAKAIQFRLETNQAVDDNTILTFQSITKGSNISDPSWILETNVVRGPITSNGASKDEIFVLLYNINQGSGWALGPGDYNDLFHVNYRIANLTGLQNNIKSSIQIAFEQGSTFDGNPINITGLGPSQNLTVIAQATNGNGWGDVNGDGCVDILDLIMVVDHIVGRDSIPASSPAFMRADIAPWPGTPTPQPDGFINVQDLSVIQNIILTQFFPNGNPVGPCGYVALPKSNGDEDAIVTIYINGEGISAYLDSRVGIRGAQIEFSSVASNPENMVINTPLGDGYYLRSDELLRTLMYDRQGQKFIGAGIDNFMADMPFNLKNPQDVSIAKLILVDMNRQKVGNIAIEVIYGTTPLPLDYILFQNYPNPFNPSTSVKFQVPKTSDVTVAVYDMLGQEVRTLFAGEVMRGTYTVNWDGINKEGAKVASGTYIYRMTAGEFIQSKKMVLIK